MFSQKYKKTEKTLESSNESKSVLWLWLLWGRGGGDFKTGGREMFTHVPLYVVSTLSVWLLYQSCLCVCLGPAHFWLLLSMANIHRKLKPWRKLERLTGKMGLPKKKTSCTFFGKLKIVYWDTEMVFQLIARVCVTTEMRYLKYVYLLLDSARCDTPTVAGSSTKIQKNTLTFLGISLFAFLLRDKKVNTALW